VIQITNAAGSYQTTKENFQNDRGIEVSTRKEVVCHSGGAAEKKAENF